MINVRGYFDSTFVINKNNLKYEKKVYRVGILSSTFTILVMWSQSFKSSFKSSGKWGLASNLASSQSLKSKYSGKWVY